MSTYKTIYEFFTAVETAIRPGTKGAPARREHYNKLISINNQHSRNLIVPSYRGWNEKHPEHKALILQRRGLSFDQYFYERAINNQNRRHGQFILRCKQLARWNRFNALQIEIKIRWAIKHHNKTRDFCQSCYIPEMGHVPGKLSTWLSNVYFAQNEHRMLSTGEIIIYSEDTEWVKYGKKSYPRITDRYLQKIELDGTINTIYHLGARERAESALNKYVPGRAEAIKNTAEMEKIAVIECYKMVGKSEKGNFVSIFDGKTTYSIGKITSDKIRKSADERQQCVSGGIFVHNNPQSARDQKYPDESKGAELPRFLLRGYGWGNKNIGDYKIAVEHFQPVEIMVA